MILIFHHRLGVIFTNVPDDADEIPAHVQYKIRQEIDTVQNPRWKRHRYANFQFIHFIIFTDTLKFVCLLLGNYFLRSIAVPNVHYPIILITFNPCRLCVNFLSSRKNLSLATIYDQHFLFKIILMVMSE